MHISNEISKCKARIEELTDQMVRDVLLRCDILLGTRSIYDEYPNWRNDFFGRDQIGWLDFRIRVNQNSIKSLEQKLKELYKERAWYEVDYYRECTVDELSDIIGSDGFIIGIKL